jgi:hypothetical protein
MTRTAKRPRRLWDSYCFPGFRPEQTVCGVFGDPKARVIKLNRRSKKRLAAVAVACRWAGTIASYGACAICRAVKRERLDFLADNPLYTQRITILHVLSILVTRFVL